jgi:hypothetical protein
MQYHPCDGAAAEQTADGLDTVNEYATQFRLRWGAASQAADRAR